MALNPQFPNYANGPAGTEVIGWTTVGGQPLYRLPNASVNLSFGFGLVALGSTLEAPTYPEGVYTPDPNITDVGQIIGAPQVNQTLLHTVATVTGTQPITVSTAWIRQVANKQTIVGTGNSYLLTSADIGSTIIARTTATNSVGTVESQTNPFGPITSEAPVITDAGTLTSNPPNPTPGGSGSITALTLTNGGSGYVYLLGAPTVDISGDGTGASATATLAEEGYAIAAGNPTAGTATPDSSGTITLTGEGSETDIVLDWTADSGGVITLSVNQPGSGWTQANVNAAIDETYGTRTITNTSEWGSAPTISAFIGVPIAGVTLVNGGSDYTNATATIVPVAGDTFGSGATIDVTVGAGAAGVYPTQTVVYSGPTVTGYNPSVSWMWGYGSGADFTPIQSGGLTYGPVPTSAVGKEIFVKVLASNLGGEVEAYSTGVEVEGAEPEPVVIPRIGPKDLYVDETVTGQQGTWRGFPTPAVTDWGFAYFADPTPTPIPGASKVYSYKVTEADQGQQLVFYVTAENTSGSTTAYSLPTDEVFDTLKVETAAQLSGASVPAEVGDVLTGVPAVYDPVGAYQYSYFAYQDPATGELTEIAGTRDTTSYTIPEADSGKQIVYYSFGSIIGKYGQETLGSTSQSTGRIWEFLQPLGRGTVTFAGDAPLIGATATATVGDVVPAIDSQAGGPTVTNISAYYVEENEATGDVQYWFIAQEENPTGPLSFTIPEKADGFGLSMRYEVEYQDAAGTGPVQQKTAPYTLPTPPVEGVKPFVDVDPEFDPANVYNAGQTIAYVRGQYSGVPDPTDTWAWYLASDAAGTDSVMVQNGGLTYVLPDNSEGKWVSTITTVSNAAGSIAIAPAPKHVAGPLPVWTREPVLTGNPLMTATEGTTLNAITPLARDPITGKDAFVTWQWMAQYPGQDPTPLGHPFTSFSFTNENGRWTGADIYLQGRAENAIGVVYIDSNRITLVGTPRIISEGTLYANGISQTFRFGVTLCTADGGGQDITDTWEILATQNGVPVAGFSNPKRSIGLSAFPAIGQYQGEGQQSITNDQGSTVFNFAQIGFSVT